MCIINHTHRFIFVHVPKNAGTSVTTFLSAFSTYRDQEIGGTPMGQALEPYFQRRYGLTKHTPAHRIRDIVGPETFSHYHVFATTRSPYERTVSMWKFLRQWDLWHDMPRFAGFVEGFARIDDVNGFVASELFETDGPDDIFKPQVHWLADPESGELLTDSLVRVEALPASLTDLCARIGHSTSDVSSSFPSLNRGAGLGGDVLDARSRARIEARYAVDFEAFAYPRRDGGPAAATLSGAAREPSRGSRLGRLFSRH